MANYEDFFALYCPVCKEHTSAAVRMGRDVKGGDDVAIQVACLNCGVVRISEWLLNSLRTKHTEDVKQWKERN